MRATSPCAARGARPGVFCELGRRKRRLLLEVSEDAVDPSRLVVGVLSQAWLAVRSRAVSQLDLAADLIPHIPSARGKVSCLGPLGLLSGATRSNGRASGCGYGSSG